MPTYVYEILDDEGRSTGERFEIVQPITDAALTEHPETGRPVRRVPQAPSIASEMSDLKSAGKLSDANLDRLGFTKFKRQGDGTYERTAGKMGPRHIDPRDD